VSEQRRVHSDKRTTEARRSVLQKCSLFLHTKLVCKKRLDCNTLIVDFLTKV
jgi:hypothetical protein